MTTQLDRLRGICESDRDRGRLKSLLENHDVLDALDALASATTARDVLEAELDSVLDKFRSVKQERDTLQAQIPQWRPMGSAPRHTEVLWWIVPKTPEEAYVNTSGDPIFGTHAPYLHKGRDGTWSSLSKATHWMPLPAPPGTETPRSEPKAAP